MTTEQQDYVELHQLHRWAESLERDLMSTLRLLYQLVEEHDSLRDSQANLMKAIAFDPTLWDQARRTIAEFRGFVTFPDEEPAP